MADERANDLKTGSCILLVVVLISIVTIYLTVIWKSTSYVTDFATEQEEYMRTQILYHSLQNYVVAFIKNNFDKLMLTAHEQKRTIEFKFHWPPDNKKTVAELMVTAPSKNNLAFEAQFRNQLKFPFTLKAAVQKIMSETSNVYKITAWQSYS